MESHQDSKKITIDRPRKYKRRMPPRMVITPKILEINDISIKNDNLAYGILYELYINKKFSQSKISELFGVQRQTVKRWLDRLKIPVKERADMVSETLIKYKRKQFSNNLREKSYLIGLRCGDISSQKHGRHIRIYIGTTHPAMAQVFINCFEKYGKVKSYSKLNKQRKAYSWCLYADLDKTFNFLLKKTSDIPEWILNDAALFFSFLSGYFDAEGCLSTYYSKKDKCGTIQWIIKSCDKKILTSIVKKLNELGFHLQDPKIERKAQDTIADVTKLMGFPYRKDYWSIHTGKKSQIITLLDRTSLKHQEKIDKYKLSKELLQTNWKNYDEKISVLRKQIKENVINYIDEAERHYSVSHCS